MDLSGAVTFLNTSKGGKQQVDVMQNTKIGNKYFVMEAESESVTGEWLAAIKAHVAFANTRTKCETYDSW